MDKCPFCRSAIRPTAVWTQSCQHWLCGTFQYAGKKPTQSSECELIVLHCKYDTLVEVCKAALAGPLQFRSEGVVKRMHDLVYPKESE